MRNMQERLLIIFSRTPLLGKVKSRIANDLGAEKALQIHIQLFEYTLNLAKESGFPYKVYLSEITVSNKLLSYSIQHGNNLGDRMLNAIKEGLHRTAKVCIIGSDCLELTANDISMAFKALDNSDIVIGPALDGGYYLIGMKKPHAEVFRNINWGKASVFEETLKQCKQLNLKTFMLEKRRDVDTQEDIPLNWL